MLTAIIVAGGSSQRMGFDKLSPPHEVHGRRPCHRGFPGERWSTIILVGVPSVSRNTRSCKRRRLQ
jgi:hypothetical protein